MSQKSVRQKRQSAKTVYKQRALSQAKRRETDIVGKLLLTLEEVGILVKRGQFDIVLRNQITELEKIVRAMGPILQAENEILYLKARCLISEYFDHYGRTAEALEAVKDGEKVYDELRARVDPPSTMEEREILRERVRLVLNYAQAKYYRIHNYGRAKELVEFCLKFTIEKLRDRVAFSCAGTLAQIMDHLGRIHRQTHLYEDAMKDFDQAIEFLHERGKRKQKQYENNPDKRRHEMNFVRYKSAMCLALGLGWVSYTRGQLRQALHYIHPAHVLVLTARDPYNAAGIDLIHGTILRALGNVNEETIKLIEGARDTYKKSGHKSHWMRAASELSLAYLHIRNLDQAESALNEVEDILAESINPRWWCNTLVIRSRIERDLKSNYSTAEELASTAYKIACEQSQTLCKIDALIARSEAQIKRQAMDEARAGLDLAIELNRNPESQRTTSSPNPKIDAVCYLHLAHTYVLERKWSQAEALFQSWEKLQQEVEHAFVRNLAASIKEEIDRSLKIDFHIPADVPATQLDYERWDQELKKFLISRAKQKTEEKKVQARLLGVSRPTLDKWEADIKREGKQ